MLALFAGIAVGASALIGAAPASAADAPPGGYAYVALGDSEAAGTGLLPYVDNDCRRSLKSYPRVVGADYSSAVSFACAGATTADATAQFWAAVQSGSAGPATELVTITVGINDIGWQSVLLACSSAGNDLACQTAYGNALTLAQGLPTSIATLVGTVRAVLPQADVVVGGYPLLFGDLIASCSIGSFQGTQVSVSPMQAAMANAGVTGVNQAIWAGTVAAGGTYVDIGSAFDGHGLCDTSGPWVSGLVSGNRTSDRSLHLNWPGQRAYAAAMLAAA